MLEVLTSHTCLSLEREDHTALRSTPELASPSVKISFLFKGFLLLFPIRDLIDAKKFDANFPSALAASICFLDAKIWNLASEDPFLASK
jgi:hypothetical protein